MRAREVPPCKCDSAHLVLVGTSLLRNVAAAISRCASGDSSECGKLGLSPHDAKNLLGINPIADCLNSVTGRGGSPGSCVDVTAYKGFVDAVQSYLNYDYKRASAELNAMQNVIDAECKCVATIILYSTDTPEGYLSADLLKSYLSSRCSSATIRVKRIPNLGTDVSVLWEGLSNLAAEVRRDSKKLRDEGLLIALNLTGGFKPEGGFTLLYGYYGGIDVVYYIHEFFKNPVAIPALTLEDVSTLVINCEALKTVDGRRVLTCSHSPCKGNNTCKLIFGKLCRSAHLINQIMGGLSPFKDVACNCEGVCEKECYIEVDSKLVDVITKLAGEA